jgi:chitodextrinase
MKNILKKYPPTRNRAWLLFIVAFGVVGAGQLLITRAAGSSTISGYAFKDINRNGVKDAGEGPWADHLIYLLDANGTYIRNSRTDSTGKYIFGSLEDGSYSVMYESNSYRSIANEWVPTTTGHYLNTRKNVNLVSNSTADFGWRQIVNSTDENTPFVTETLPNGLRIEIFNDVVQPSEVYGLQSQGSLIGDEVKNLKITIARPGSSTAAATSYATDSSGRCYNSSGALNVTWDSWYWSTRDRSFFHEYGHVWEGYFSCVHQDKLLIEYQKARGIYGNPLVNSSYGWNVQEMIADDYRQLFGSPSSKVYSHLNSEVPSAQDVPGLKEYLSGAFLQPPSAAATAPTNLGVSASNSEEGPSVSLNWSASTGSVMRYEIYRNNVKVGFVNSPTTNYYDGSGLSYSTAYSYYVKAVDASGTSSAASNTVSVTTPAADNIIPSAPSGLTSPAQTKTSISLQWTSSTDNVGIKEYRIYQVSRKLAAELKGTATNTNFTVTGLKSNTSFMFYVVAVDASGNESIASNTLSVKTKR